MPRLRKSLDGKVTMAAVGLCVLLDIAALVFIAMAGAGPLTNSSLYWGKYVGARYAGATTTQDVTTGMWGYCRTNSTATLNPFDTCATWWNGTAPFYYWYSLYFYYSIVSLQIICCVTLSVGALTLLARNPRGLMIAGVVAAFLFVPCFSCMTWLNYNVSIYLAPYESYSNGPAFTCGIIAFALLWVSMILKCFASMHGGSDAKEVALELSPDDMAAAKQQDALVGMPPTVYAQAVPAYSVAVQQPMYAAPPAGAMYAAPPTGASVTYVAPPTGAPVMYAAPPVK